MLKNDAFILVLAYPETIVHHPQEWYSNFLRFGFIGNKKYVRAGHTALILINKETCVLEYYDFGRYITTAPYGRVRSKETDFELDFSVKSKIEDDKIVNLNEILSFFATQPKLTHGCGTMMASVCNTVDYKMAKSYIRQQQNKGFIRYAVFMKNASNCARFVADTLIASVSHVGIKKKLLRSKWFTPSTIGNVIVADTENYVYSVSEKGEISQFNSTVSRENLRLFLDRLKGYSPSLAGTIEPKQNTSKSVHAQWLSGIGVGGWFEIYSLPRHGMYRFKRISPCGTINCDAIYKIDDLSFNINSGYRFAHHSNCAVFYIQQNEKIFKFYYIEDYLELSIVSNNSHERLQREVVIRQ